MLICVLFILFGALNHPTLNMLREHEEPQKKKTDKCATLNFWAHFFSHISVALIPINMSIKDHPQEHITNT